MFRTPLTEEMKREIRRLYQTTDLPIEAIAAQLKISASSVNRYWDYGDSIENEPRDQPIETIPEKPQIHKTRRYRCTKCSHITDTKGIICPNCHTGPFDSIFIEIGSPQDQEFMKNKIEKPVSQNRIKQSRSQEISNTTGSIEAIKESPDHEEPTPQDNTEPKDENETDAMTGEEEPPEFEYECPRCHHQFNEVLESCPHCGLELEDSWECPRCHHRWYGSSDKCQKCGTELQA